MGEIAEMMLEGFLDEETGEVIDGESPGYPRRMSEMPPICCGKPPRSEAELERRRLKARRKRQRMAERRRVLREAGPANPPPAAPPRA